ncbi:hypothetical protein ABB37_08107 [Leptomonas pyrrhocoris]|uniref:RING-type domain-containing protein n=1 Tax=Leptomonas pyrrhocoris TaxID=157538 RepID=A0A0N0VDL5_LEPPY|nr:hypothetical protein ABB37_08107 [Leptomonas pyrrhocoris]XP_015654384.1 hypothetical protein ABB37_08107 [Leptomonas pyrrhocoris]KPA75944.1 hypothetical protein ABB37_08107 [Leptomonas pyrrhocoris]KPA75945.1 hypothetical protein ABB37_08107 [Leptomonas pyrrhocoris]|eukprot:XP_015654383.1 hypothetical protein ABB37_08107 [Leptomonas pyrrhocoris]
MPLAVLGGGLFRVLLAGTAIVLSYCAATLAVLYRHRRRVNTVGYYRLPSKDDAHAVSAARERAQEEDRLEMQVENADAERGSAGSRRHCGPCCCCCDLRGRYAFVQCGHLCICEPCLITLGHECEASRGSPFKGPCQLPCPVCRRKGFLIKTFSG